MDLESSLLNGYSIVVSDNINVKGFKTSAGTKALKNYKPYEDAEVIKKLREEGGLVLGIFLFKKYISVFDVLGCNLYYKLFIV